VSAVSALRGLGDSTLADAITLVVWCTLAVAAVLLVARRPRLRRGTWPLVAACCCVIALDKAIDVQTVVYRLVRWCCRATESAFRLREQHPVVKACVLLTATGGVCAVAGWLLWRDRPLDRPRAFAAGGLLLVVLLVGLRLVPGLDWLDAESHGWIVEGAACAAIAFGLRGAWRQDTIRAQRTSANRPCDR
jgi:hypothetical protein